MGAIDYTHVFAIGADQHFACLDDGQTSSPGFACVNCAAMFGKYEDGLMHIPDVDTWYVGQGTRYYAAWGRDYYGSVSGVNGKIWNQGAFALIEIVTQKKITVSLYNFDGMIIDNDITEDTGVVKAGGVTETSLTAVAGGWLNDEHNMRMLVLTSGAHSGHQYIITDSTADTLTCYQADFVNDGVLLGDDFEIHSRPYTKENMMDYLGELTMDISDDTYYLVNETFETASGEGADSSPGCDEAWTDSG